MESRLRIELSVFGFAGQGHHQMTIATRSGWSELNRHLMAWKASALPQDHTRIVGMLTPNQTATWKRSNVGFVDKPLFLLCNIPEPSLRIELRSLPYQGSTSPLCFEGERECFIPMSRYKLSEDISTDLPGGSDRDRTCDLRLAKPALSQLSYRPISGADRNRTGGLPHAKRTLSRLSYNPIVIHTGIEPVASTLSK